MRSGTRTRLEGLPGNSFRRNARDKKKLGNDKKIKKKKEMFVRSATFATAAKRNEGEGGRRVCVVCFIDFRFIRDKKKRKKKEKRTLNTSFCATTAVRY